MDTKRRHEALISGIAQQFKPILDGSEQGIYIYLDDAHKVCNERFAGLLGYASAQEWAALPGPLLEAMVDTGSQEALVSAYRKAVERYLGSALEVSWRKKGGGKVDTKVILVPIVFETQPLALHFVYQA